MKGGDSMNKISREEYDRKMVELNKSKEKYKKNPTIMNRLKKIEMMLNRRLESQN